MRRVEPTPTVRRRLLAGLCGLGLAFVLAACASGQITQTDTVVAPVNGASGNAGPIAVRNAQLAFPSTGQDVYQPGSDAPLVVTIVNTGLTSDELVRVTTPAANQVTIDGAPTGTKTIPGSFSVSAGTDVDDQASGAAAAPTTSATPTSASGAAMPSTVSIVLTGIKSINGEPLRSGLTIPVTFVFAHGGQVTLNVPIAAPADNATSPATATSAASQP